MLEAAGPNNRFDFEEQFSTETEEGRRRPDVKVRMPGGGMVSPANMKSDLPPPAAYPASMTIPVNN